MVFAFKTYLYRLDEIKAEAQIEGERRKSREQAEGESTLTTAEQLAEAIDGMRKGSAPEVWEYKRALLQPIIYRSVKGDITVQRGWWYVFS